MMSVFELVIGKHVRSALAAQKPKAPRRCPHNHWNFNCRPIVFCDDCGEILSGHDPYNHVGVNVRPRQAA